MGLEGITMLSQTSELGIYITLYLALAGDGPPVTPRRLAEVLGGSQTYISKVTGNLVKAGILRAQRGARGGVLLNHKPEQITLLMVVEACQGVILPDYCGPTSMLRQVCSYHRAMHELHQALTGVLKRWTFAELAKKPCASDSLSENLDCRLAWCRDLVGKPQ